MENFSEIAKVFKAFDDEKRLHILNMLQNGEKCACVLLEDMKISQSTLSHHMKILCDSGIVKCDKRGKWCYYSISNIGSKNAQKLLGMITNINSNNFNV